MSAIDVRAVTDWLGNGARPSSGPVQLMADLGDRLVAAGLPLWRVGVFVQTLHPEIFGRNFIWRPGQEVTVGSAPYGIQDSEEFLASPLRRLYNEGQEVRYRLDAPESRAFPFFDDMRAEGVTDYIAIPLHFLDGAIHGSSWTTRHPQGFTDDAIHALRVVVPPLTRLVEVIGLRRIASTLLDTYVGSRAGGRILAGQIRRGHAESMRAAIWLSDMRRFTALSDRLPAEAVVEILNRFFDCQVAPILAHGGEVLKFMGDGLLAVFPILEAGDGDDSEMVCGRVLSAAREASAGVAALSNPTLDNVMEQIRFGVGLHVGKVLYGNIGGGNRLDFTCIGPAVNLAARLEKIAGTLGRTIVASAGFSAVSGAPWVDLGDFPITGFASTERVYGLPGDV